MTLLSEIYVLQYCLEPSRSAIWRSAPGIMVAGGCAGGAAGQPGDSSPVPD